jgi:hypothetical protein
MTNDELNSQAVQYGRALADGVRRMGNLERIDDHYAFACDCGSVHFNLLKSGVMECAGCHARFGEWEQ